MNRSRTLGIFAVLMIAAVSCGSTDRQVLNPTEPGQIVRWEGSIDDPFLRQIQALDFSRDVLISISSPGGSPETGVKVAEILSAQNYTVEVTDACLSACANYVFLPASTRRIAPGAFVGFHHDAASYHNWIESSGKTPNPNVAGRAMRLEALMTQRSDFNWKAFSQNALTLLKPDRIEEVPCATLQPEPGSPCFDIIARRLMWVPTPTDYEVWGISVDWSPNAGLPNRVAQFVACRTTMNFAPSVVGSDSVYQLCER